MSARASYAWNWVTRADVVYVTVVYGDPPQMISDARVDVFDPEKNSDVREVPTNETGIVILRDIGARNVYLTVTFDRGDKRIRSKKYIELVLSPTNAEFGKNDTWAESQMTTRVTNIEPRRRRRFLGPLDPVIQHGWVLREGK